MTAGGPADILTPSASETLESTRTMTLSNPFSTLLLLPWLLLAGAACTQQTPSAAPAADIPTVVRPALETAAVSAAADDPAIWINRADPAGSLIIGTD